MADKNIGSLPAAAAIDDNSLFVAEQQGAAVRVSGAVIKDYAKASAAKEADRAELAASRYPSVQNGTWWVWNAATEKYTDTGVKAQGETGPEGKQGQQGEIGSPGVSCTHKWNGTTLTVTSASGSSSADLKGDKGDTGEKGETGNPGPRGEKGETGQGFKVLDYYETIAALRSAVPSPNVGDAYGVGTGSPYDIYIYGATSGWVNNGPLQGAKGDTGDPFEYEDFTEEQLAELVGPTGPAGKDGAAANITGASASVDNNVGTPSVEVTLGGTSTARTFAFVFKNMKGEPGADGKDGAAGAPGVAGYTPVKGTDYWTPADQQSMVNSVLAALPTWTGGSF